MAPTRSVRWLEAGWLASRAQWIDLLGGSMAPTLLDGDRLLVEPIASGGVPAIGELAVTRRGARLVVHRVVAHRDGQIIMRGDACAVEDPAVEPGEILGRVVRVERTRWRRFARRLLRAVGIRRA